MSSVLTNLDPSLRKGWLPLCRSQDATGNPTAFSLLDQQWVVWRTPQGEVKVFEDVCPHRLAPLSLGTCEGDEIRCGYHGWKFNQDGVCVEIPALGPNASLPPKARLKAPFAVIERHLMVFIAIEEPFATEPHIAVANDSSFLAGHLPVLEVRANAGLLADNFLDMAHFPFVHASTFGADEVREVPQYSVTRTDWGFEAAYEHEFANREDPGVASGIRPLIQLRRLTYRYQAPFHLELAIEFLDAGGTNVIGFFLAPVNHETVRIYSTLWRDDLEGSAERMQEAIDFEIAVIEEDLRVQSSYQKLELPLDVTTEVHTRADKTTLELRRILAEFVTTASK